MREVEIVFEGRPVAARIGETVASALAAAGERAFRLTRQGEPRGLFCGMGVCQECLVEIDGRPGQRACMTKVEGPLAIKRQRTPAALEAGRPRGRAAPDTLTPDVAVIGGGAGGLAAAATAAAAGAEVLLIDERPMLGGQYYKQPAFARPDDAQFAGGRGLIAEAEAAGVRFLTSALVWGAFEPLDLMVAHAQATRLARPKRLIVATGAYERPLPVPGWTLPGVMTTGAAQTLLRGYGVLPGRRILVAGNGPLNAQVALELAQAGAEIAAVAELAPLHRMGGALPMARMAFASPPLLLQGARLLAGLARRRIPLLRGHVLKGILGKGEALEASLAAWPSAGRPALRYEVDVVCMGYGFMPANELLRLLDCRHAFDPRFGHLRTVRDADCRTTVDGVYAIGDCTGLGGAPAAVAEGRIAGASAARSLGLAASDPGRARAALKRHRRFQEGLWRLFGAAFPGLDLATPETIVCRCEELTLAEVDAGLAEGPVAIGSIKRLTRSGMGACQGRYCGPLIAALLAARAGRPIEAMSFWAPRPPAKPVAIADIVEEK